MVLLLYAWNLHTAFHSYHNGMCADLLSKRLWARQRTREQNTALTMCHAVTFFSTSPTVESIVPSVVDIIRSTLGLSAVLIADLFLVCTCHYLQ